MARTCCPQYTIRLESLEYKPNKKHRQVINRFNRYLLTGERPGDGESSNEGAGAVGKSKVKGKGKQSEDWIDTLRAHQVGHGIDAKHRFEVGQALLHTLQSWEGLADEVL